MLPFQFIGTVFGWISMEPTELLLRSDIIIGPAREAVVKAQEALIVAFKRGEVHNRRWRDAFFIILGDSPHNLYATVVQWVKSSTEVSVFQQFPSFTLPAGESRALRVSTFDEAATKFSVAGRGRDLEWCFGSLKVTALHRLKSQPSFNQGRRWTMDDGRWTMDDGRWTMDDGRWTTRRDPLVGQVQEHT